jgi:hypothetical protein
MVTALIGGYVAAVPLGMWLQTLGSGIAGACLMFIIPGFGCAAVLYGIALAGWDGTLFPLDRVAIADELERTQAEAEELKRRLELGDEAVRREKYQREKEAWEQQVLEAKANGTRPPATPVPLAPPGRNRS